MLNQRRTLLVAAAAMCLSALSAARAADYPVKPITVVVGYAAGGPTDVLMRAMAPRLTEDLKQQILVDNRPGANEIIAAQIVAKSPPDGYTLFLCTEAPLTQNQFMYSKLNYNPEKDFTPITQLLSAPMTFIVPTTLPVNSLEEFVALAKARTATKPLIYGSAGIGGVSHLPMAMFAKQSGLEMVHVPYKGIAPLVPDVVAARVDAAWVGVAGAAPFVREGKVKALVVAAPSRLKVLPQTPTFSETSVAPVQADFIFALMAPAGTPSAITERIAALVKKSLSDPKFREVNLDPFGYVVVASTPAELGQFLAKDRPLQAERIKVSGAKLD